ncbi:hypothetical protein [Lysobacter gummosus]|uniref:hypothetical protein n=1 Tax=Lysobacter gummosus TaxID=262324 RepID=UPI00363C4F50
MKGRACEPQVRAALNARRLCLRAGGPGGFAFALSNSKSKSPGAASETLFANQRRAPAPFQRGRIDAASCGSGDAVTTTPYDAAFSTALPI